MVKGTKIYEGINITFLLNRNGGWCMHDETEPHYIDMIDQTTYEHKFIKQQFNVTPRIGCEIDHFGHSAVQPYLLGAEVGFDSVFFGLIDYQDRNKRKGNKHLEVIWPPGHKLLIWMFDDSLDWWIFD
ncbi:hypothetical protein LXL04_028923 [Taraxacum kok-saghyz]